MDGSQVGQHHRRQVSPIDEPLSAIGQGALTLRRLRNLSCLAPDVELVCIVNEVGPALTVADELTEQRRAETANLLCVGAVESAGACQQVVDQYSDLRVFVGKAGYGVGQPRRGLEESTVQPARTLGDIDVFVEVGGESDERNVDMLSPSVRPVRHGCRQGPFQRAHRLAHLGAATTQRIKEDLLRPPDTLNEAQRAVFPSTRPTIGAGRVDRTGAVCGFGNQVDVRSPSPGAAVRPKPGADRSRPQRSEQPGSGRPRLD